MKRDGRASNLIEAARDFLHVAHHAEFKAYTYVRVVLRVKALLDSRYVMFNFYFALPTK